MTIAPDFREFAACLNAHDVRYLIVGGYAVAFHGHPRYTKDLDVWIDRDPANARKLLGALADFGFGSVGLTEADFTEPEQVVQLERPPLRIDLLTSVTGIAFADCYSHREAIEIEGTEVPFIGLNDLRENKRATGRHQDLADLEDLE